MRQENTMGLLTPNQLESFNSQGNQTNPFTSLIIHTTSILILNYSIQSYACTGYIVLESFSSKDEIDSMIKRMEQLVDQFDPSSTASIFSTKNQVSYLITLLIFI